MITMKTRWLLVPLALAGTRCMIDLGPPPAAPVVVVDAGLAPPAPLAREGAQMSDASRAAVDAPLSVAPPAPPPDAGSD